MNLPFKIKVPSKVSNFFLKTAAKVKYKRPEILLIIGLGSGFAAVIVTGVNTWRNKEQLSDDMCDVRYLKEYDPNTILKDNPHADIMMPDEVHVSLRAAKRQLAHDIIHTYWLPFLLTAGSATCIIFGHRILRKELAAMTASYALLLDSYNRYRQNVIADGGIEKDQEYMHGIKVVDAIDAETGEVYKKAIPAGNHSGSRYARWYDEGDYDSVTGNWIWRNPNWNRNKKENIRRVKFIQSSLNDTLHMRGWMKLNEAYTAFGLPCTAEGEHVGWVIGSGHNDFIDVGVFPDYANGAFQLPVNKLFLDERNPQNNCLLDFNVDGCIDYIFENILEYDNQSYIVGRERCLKG